ncbi:uncharacterized protein [Clytia hemisphaerica]|uniref:ShKT domain-containing protein n=1 Tax=Clytia hemisphaerica TaxID=252671 RepID=A0A7M5V7D1_9CNID
MENLVLTCLVAIVLMANVSSTVAAEACEDRIGTPMCMKLKELLPPAVKKIFCRKTSGFCSQDETASDVVSRDKRGACVNKTTYCQFHGTWLACKINVWVRANCQKHCKLC